jgi:hypothetical protein
VWTRRYRWSSISQPDRLCVWRSPMFLGPWSTGRWALVYCFVFANLYRIKQIETNFLLKLRIKQVLLNFLDDKKWSLEKCSIVEFCARTWHYRINFILWEIRLSYNLMFNYQACTSYKNSYHLIYMFKFQ